jgi:hypothetical protein
MSYQKSRYSPGQRCRTLTFYYTALSLCGLSNDRPHRQGKQSIYIVNKFRNMVLLCGLFPMSKTPAQKNTKSDNQVSQAYSTSSLQCIPEGHPLNYLFSSQNIEYKPHFNGCPSGTYEMTHATVHIYEYMHTVHIIIYEYCLSVLMYSCMSIQYVQYAYESGTPGKMWLLLYIL